MKLICNICNYDIAEISNDIKIPIQGSMFTSKDPKHGFPPPWNPVASWEHLYCPMCQRRAFDVPDENNNFTLKTDKGDLLVTQEGISDDMKDKSITEYLRKISGVKENKSISEKEAQEPVINSTVPDIPSNVSGAGETSSVDINLPPGTSGPLDSGFDKYLKLGEVVQKGSWYEYKGKNYRKSDLIEKLNG